MLKIYPKSLQYPLVLIKIYILRTKAFLLQMKVVLSLLVNILYAKLKLWIDSKRYKAYGSIESCPIWNFHKVVEKNDIRYLLKLKNYDKLPTTKYEPYKEWTNIVSENMADIGSATYGQSQKAELSIELMQNEYHILATCLTVLGIKTDSTAINLLKTYGIEISLDNINAYKQSLQILDNRIGALKMKIDIKREEFKSANKPKTDNVKLDFAANYIEIGKYEGFRFDPKVRSVKDYNTAIRVINNKNS